jgi:subtilisin family serine protease
VELQMPVAINLSFGNTYGAHNGTSLLERFIDNLSEIGKNVICVGSGNEGASGGHVGGKLADTDAFVELVIGSYERGCNVQLWKEYTDRYQVTLVSPSGESFAVDTDRPGKQIYRLGQTTILLYNGEPAPYLTGQELYFDLLPEGNNTYIDAGVWTFVLTPVRIVTGNYTFYLPSGTVRNADTRFVRTTPDVTLTIPSTASKVITVGAYDTVYDAYADFSGRGYLYQDRVNSRMPDSFVKPDLVAPGIGILAPGREGGYTSVTGTSFAVPFVSGAAALLLQWGIVDGNDPYLYGEKVKAYLRKGARQLTGFTEYPNPQTGYGALCVRESIPT